ncbi:MAG: VCBS repeat-containing protein [Pirellulaceae bacterium]|nr:VCBS repeat-containing protein [Pirellulaceae bacterium]
MLAIIPGLYGYGMVTSDSDVFRLDVNVSPGELPTLTPHYLGKLMDGTSIAAAARDDAVFLTAPGGEFICVADAGGDPLGLPSVLRQTSIDVFNTNDPTSELAITILGPLQTPAGIDVRLNALEVSPGLVDVPAGVYGAGYLRDGSGKQDAVFFVDPVTRTATPIFNLDTIPAESAGDITSDASGGMYVSLVGGDLLKLTLEWNAGTSIPDVISHHVYDIEPDGPEFEGLIWLQPGNLIGIEADRDYHLIDLASKTVTPLGTLTHDSLSAGEQVYGATTAYQEPVDLGTITGVVQQNDVPPILGQRWYEFDVQQAGHLMIDIVSGGTADSAMLLYDSLDGPPAAEGGAQLHADVAAGATYWLRIVDLEYGDTADFRFELLTGGVPELQHVEVETPISEGDWTTLTGSVANLDLSHSWNLQVDWGAPFSPPDSQTVVLGSAPIDEGGVVWNPTTRQFSLDHQYPDDDADDQYTIRVALGGGFQTPFNLATEQGAGGLAIGDFNGDSYPDVAVSTNIGAYPYNPGVFRVFLNDGAGGFGAGTTYDPGGGAWTGSGIATADFNNDGKLDIVLTHGGSNSLGWGIGSR